MNAAVTAVLTLIQQVLPLITASGAASTGIVASIVNALSTWLPLIVTEVDTLYEPVKNIIEALKQTGAVTPDQLTTLTALDSKMDAAFEAAAAAVDPDAQPLVSP